MQYRRRVLYRKLIDSNVSKNKVLKKNRSKETTVCKYKLGVFNPSMFAHFKGKDGAEHFNDWIIANTGKKKIRLLLTLYPPPKNLGYL